MWGQLGWVHGPESVSNAWGAPTSTLTCKKSVAPGEKKHSCLSARRVEELTCATVSLPAHLSASVSIYHAIVLYDG